MAFTPAPFSTHAQYLPKNLSLLLEPRFLNYAHVKVPAPRLPPLNGPAGPYVDLPKDWLIEPCRDATLQLPPLNSRKLLSPSFTHDQPLPYTSFHAGIGNGRERGNAFNFKNWQISSEWLKYVESVKFQSFKRSNNDRSKDLFPVSDWSNAIGVQSTPTITKEDIICPFSRCRGNVELETASDDTQTSGLKSYTSNATDTQVIRHSIREILKPRENSPLPHDTRRHKRRNQNLHTEATNIKSTHNAHESGLNRKYFKSDGIRSDKNHKDLRFKLRQKVSSVLTKPSSSHTEMRDVTSSKSSRKSKAHSVFDSLGDISTFSRTTASMSDFLESQPMSPQDSMTRNQSERKTFQCPQCRYVTDRKNNLKRHIVTMHQDSGKVLECCGIPFQSKAALRDHNTVFHRGGYRCQICARNFCRKALLRRHLTVHSGQKDFFCELCGYATSHKSNLERHQKVHVRKSDDILSLGSKQIFHSKSSLNLSQTENRSKQVTSSFLDVGRVTLSINDEFMDDSINGHEYLSNFDHVNDDTESPFNREFYSPTRYKGKRAGFFTSRLEETYDKTAEHIPSFIPSIPSEQTEMIKLDSNAMEQSDCDAVFTKYSQQTDGASYDGQCSEQENKNSDTKPVESDCRIFDENKESTEENPKAQKAGESVPGDKNVHEPSNSLDPNFAAQEESEIDLALPYKAHDDETPGTEKDVCKKRQKVQSKCKICPVFYQCDDCGQKLPSQHEVYSHSCSKISEDRIMGLSLVTALQKGCLKAQN